MYTILSKLCLITSLGCLVAAAYIVATGADFMDSLDYMLNSVECMLFNFIEN